MTEPTSSTAVITISVGTVAVTGSVLGIEYSCLLFGLLGGLIRLSKVAPTTRIEAFATVVTAALVGGAAAPTVSAVAVSVVSALGRVPPDSLSSLAALAIGGLWQTLLPLALVVFRRRTGGGRHA